MRTEIEILLVGVGGALGAAARYGIAEAARKSFPLTFPMGTLIANLAGCFLIGLLLGSGHADKNDSLRLGLGIGFLGALTTFSTFGAETIGQLQTGNWTLAILNIAANVVLGLTGVVLGIVAGRKLFG